jgi:hypothetical protein
MVGYAIISVKIKAEWYLGEACKLCLPMRRHVDIANFQLVPAVVFGIIVGPVASRFIDSTRWGSAAKDQQEYITLVSLHVSLGLGIRSLLFTRA